MGETASTATCVDAENNVLSASNGVDCAYRITGASEGTPLVMLQHFRGNLDWPASSPGRVSRSTRTRHTASSSNTTPSSPPTSTRS
jgi:hypothetical protein